jgi:putative transposase
MKYKTRKQYRLPYFNYASSGYYFVTICSKDRRKLFGTIANNRTTLSEIGEIIRQAWLYIPTSSPYVTLDEFVIMPDHIHGIILIDNPDESREIKEKAFEVRKKSLSVVIRTLKAATTAKARKILSVETIWHPRFHDRIIRNDAELQRIRKYIQDNPVRWEEDRNMLNTIAK